MNRTAGIVLIYLSLISLIVGCAETKTYKLKMRKDRVPVNETITSPDFSDESFKTILVLPPPGSDPDKFADIISRIERECLKHGISVISGALTGAIQTGKGSDLSDTEKAIIVAGNKGADAILQIGSWKWSRKTPTRFFILNKLDKRGMFKEVSENYYNQWKGARKEYPGYILTFSGKLTDVDSGNVVVSYQIESARNWNMPVDYVATFEDHPDDEEDVAVITEEPAYETIDWEKADENTVSLVLSIIMAKLK